MQELTVRANDNRRRRLSARFGTDIDEWNIQRKRANIRRDINTGAQ